MSTTDHILGDRDTIFHTKGANESIDKRGFYTLYDQKTKHTVIKETSWFGAAFDRPVGYYDENGKFHPYDKSDPTERAFFESDKGRTQALDASAKSSQRDLQVNQGKTKEEAVAATNGIKNPNTATDENVGTQESAQIKETNPGTRKKFPTLQYPTGIDKNGQDTLKIQMMEYRARKLQSSQGSLGPEKRATGNIIGTVTLPIPGNIKDSDQVEWGSDSMNAGELALAAVATEGILGGTEGAESEAKNVLKGVASVNPESAKKGISNMMAGAAIGKDAGKLMSRSTGQVMNPNMELLFNGPSLRNFSFTFLLAPRSKDEAKNVIKIIRFFKQGMLPIRSKSNLFLKAPHTFQLKYNYKGKDEHPYLNSFKECALKSCDVNYTPENSYSTYEDGVMTAYSLTLAFSELEPIYNDDYGTEDAENLNFASGATPATEGTDPSPKPDTTGPTKDVQAFMDDSGYDRKTAEIIARGESVETLIE